LKGTETVLLVDEEDVITDVGEEIVEELGYKVLIARGGKRAVEIYQKDKEKIDIALESYPIFGNMNCLINQRPQLEYKTENASVVEYITDLNLENYTGNYNPKEVIVLFIPTVAFALRVPG